MFGLVWWCALALGIVPNTVDAVVGGSPAAAPEPDAAVVFLQRNGRSARLEGLKNDQLGYYTFIGIRYAEPPVGPRRFQRPVRKFLAGDFNATSNCYACPQPDPYRQGSMIGSEDCLCLNVFAPKMPGDESGCPVIFFIHGGNYRSGSAAAYGGQHLAQKDTILVVVQYRLGSLGYLSTGQRDASGNVGLFDLRAAMNWVNDYIQFFGGDPTRIVVMGHGSGGSAASLLALADDGPTVNGVAAMSGAPMSPGALRSDPAQHARQLAARTRCPESPAERLVACLRTRPVQEIVEADRYVTTNMVDTEAFLNEVSGRSGAGARVEEPKDQRGLPSLVTEQPAASIDKNKKLCPFITGVTSAETSRAVFGKYSKFLAGKLNEVQDFIKNDVIGGLRSAVESVPNLIPVLPAGIIPVQLPLADFYQAAFANTFDIVDGLTEIAEATGDALFNFPAYQSTRAWSKKGNAFLYSFEHVGNLTKGEYFLPGLALTESTGDINVKQKAIKGPSHGDELAYIFEALREDGTPKDDKVSSGDVKVRDSFVSLLAKFAHDLNSTTNALPFTDDNDLYIRIQDGGISLDKNFRFCQMGLWGNMATRISSALCKTKIADLINLPKKVLPVNVPLVSGQRNPALPSLIAVNPATPAVVQIPGILEPRGQGSLGGVLGSKSEESPQNKRPSFGLFNNF